MYPVYTDCTKGSRFGFRSAVPTWLVAAFIFAGAAAAPGAETKRLTLQALVQPSTVFYRDGQVVKFALHGFVEFQNLDALFSYIDEQAGRWKFGTGREREEFAAGLLRRGMQSRLVSMQYETPLEVLVTHTGEELSAAVAKVPTVSGPLLFRGTHWQLPLESYRSNLLLLQKHWKSSLNCWSAAPSVPARVLSNWYLIDEGITLFGSRYDSTEHFWQAVKYHPETRLNDLLELLDRLDKVPWEPHLDAMSANQEVYLRHTYAIEFLRSNLAARRRQGFRRDVARWASQGNRSVRQLQQRDDRNPGNIRFSALEEKVLWGDLADVFHLIHFFAEKEDRPLRSEALKPLMDLLRKHRFDAVYLQGYRGGKADFVSREFQELMLEIWKVKYLEMKRFGEVIRSTQGVYLDHFLNDGDSPDIPIPVYVGFLNQIREMAAQQKP